MTTNISIYKFLKTFVQVETNKVLHELGVEGRHLEAGFETPMHLWDQKVHHRNPLKNGSLSENMMEECERALFQPFH